MDTQTRADVAAVAVLPPSPESEAPAQAPDVPLTPMMRQYLEIKAAHPEAILFFRLGDFYEMFFEDAVRAAEILQITLTSRSKGADRVPMCGVPYHSARRYIARLIEEGLKVAICEQVEEAGSGPGIVRREVIRVITPGMVLDEEVLESRSNNFLAAISFGTSALGIALLDASTGELFAFEVPSTAFAVEELCRAQPRELVVAQHARECPDLQNLLQGMGRVPTLSTLDKTAFDVARATAFLKRHFGVASLEGYGLKDQPCAVSAAGAALRYLKDTQKTDASHVDRISAWARGGHLILDEASRTNLEVLRTLKDGSRKGSLLGTLDRTQTPMGARKLSSWLTSPLKNLPEIHARLDAVEELARKGLVREELGSALKQIGDIERLCGRLSLGAGNARDLLALGRSLTALPVLSQVLRAQKAPLLSGLVSPLEGARSLGEELLAAITEEPPITLKEGGLIRRGYDAEVDECLALSTDGKELLLQIETREKERTGISSLKVRFNRVFGYYIEVTRSNLHLVPSNYTRKQTTVGSERFVTPELKVLEEKVLTADERRCELEYDIFERLRGQVVHQAAALRAAAEAVATCDALLSFARCAAEYDYVRPQLEDSEVLELEGARHPVVERMSTVEAFVPNDLHLDGMDAQLIIITGPNMAGKSTVMRQVALCVLMAQAGSFIPAKRARIGLCDRIFTRVGAADNLARGQSTFMVEMTETSNILHHATARSLVILDEIGRGTSTFDGLSIAWAVAEHLHDRVGCRTLFATHYHELTDLARERRRVKNCSIAVKEQNGKVLFLRKLIEGGASRSYGIEVARLAGLPPEVVHRARELLENLEAGELDESGHPRLLKKLRAQATSQLGLFGPPLPVSAPPMPRCVEELGSLSVDELTPLAALNLIARWKDDLRSRGKS